MTQQAPSRTTPQEPTSTRRRPLSQTLRMSHVLRLGRLRPDVPPPPTPQRRTSLLRRFRLSRRWWIAAAVLLAALLLFAGWVVLASPWLVARTVRVQGATAATRAQVAQVAGVPVGTPLARVSLGDIADRVRSITSVHDVTVSRSWPSAITITVTQATPAAVMHDGHGYALVSTAGETYRTVDTRPDGLPLVQAQASQLTDDAVQAALDVAVAIGSTAPANVLRQVDTVSADNPLQVSVVLHDGTAVSWGSAAGSPLKARALSLLLRAQPHAGGYDVASPSTPSVTP